jgi:hypothetical protein
MNHCVTFIWNLFLLSPYKHRSKFWRWVGVINSYNDFPAPVEQIFMKFCIGSLRCLLLINAVAQRGKNVITLRWALYTAFCVQLVVEIRMYLFIYLHIYGLYKHSELDSRPVVSNDWTVVNNELERMWKEAALAFVKVLPWHLPRRTE